MKKSFARILSLTMCLLIIISAGVTGVSAAEDKEYLYEDIFVEYFRRYAEGHDNEDWEWYSYEELYYYYGEDKESGTTPDKEVTPDYVFVEGTVNMCGPMPVYAIVGDYVLFSHSMFAPYSFCYYVYVPAENKIYNLEEAVESGVEGVDRIFTEVGIGDRKGDTDRDGQITIKDATKIQKQLVEIDNKELIQSWEEYFPIYFIFDFDKDEDLTIKDATAIQKFIAGIEY